MPLPRFASFAAACALALASLSSASAATYSVGPGGDYATLTAALQDGNMGHWSGAVVLELLPAYTSSGETFPISLYGANDVTIRPQVGATNLTIGSATGVVYFGFGSRFVIDGRPGGTGTAIELSLVSTSTSSPTVTFADNAHDTLRWVNVRGANAVTGSGVVLLSPQQFNCTDVSIEHCRIGGGASPPANLVYLSSSIGSRFISDVRIDDCELFDWAQATQNSAAIVLQPGVRDVAIRRNSFYQSAARAITTAGRSQYAVLGNGAIPNLAIEDNWLGGRAPRCGGSPWTLTGVGGFTLLYLNADNASPARYRGNVIRNFDVTVATGPRVLSSFGRARVEGNVIGGTAPAEQLVFHTTTGATVLLSVASADSSVVRDNRIEGVTLAATTGSLTCLSVGTGTAPVPVARNVIGGSAAGAITTNGSGLCAGLVLSGGALGTCRVDSNEVSYLSRTAASSAQPMSGVRVTGAAASLTGNLVAHLGDAAATTAAPGTPTLAGVSLSFGAGAWARLARNVVHSLASTAATSATLVCGVSADLGTGPDALLDGSFVHSLTSASADTAAGTIGMRVDGASASLGQVRVANSMIRAGIGPNADDAVNAGRVVGAWSQGGVEWIGNSIFVGGVLGDPSAGSSRAFEMSATGGWPRLRNNVLANERGDFAPGGRHAALSFPFAIAGEFPSDYGLFWAPIGFGQGVVVQAGATTYSSLAAWQATGQDAASWQGTPMFVAPYGTAANVDLHVVHSGDLMPMEFDHGVFWIGWTTDFDGDARTSATPDIGADEFDMDDNTGVGEGPARALALAPARPNPVHGACTFEFALERAGAVSLEVFDAGGRRVRTLVRGTLEPGVHSVRWDRTDDDGAAVRPGTYFVRLAGPHGAKRGESRRVIVLE